MTYIEERDDNSRHINEVRETGPGWWVPSGQRAKDLGVIGGHGVQGRMTP